jgi:hypothetical protein
MQSIPELNHQIKSDGILCRREEKGQTTFLFASKSSTLGLSTYHISPLQDTATKINAGIQSRTRTRTRAKPPTQMSLDYYEGGQLARIRSEGGGYAKMKQKDSPQRGKCCGFSKSARRRLLRSLAKMNQEKAGMPTLVTLTYPSEYSSDWTAWKRDFDVFWKRFHRKYENAFAFWRLEFQRRGAPHFHLLVFHCGHIDKAWLSQAWYDVVSSDDTKHLKAGTRVESVRSWKGVFSYCAKYLGKVASKTEGDEEVDIGEVGRTWGIVNRAAYALVVDLVRMCVSDAEFYQIRRVFAGLINRSSRFGMRIRRARDGLHCFTRSGGKLAKFYQLKVN